MTGGLLGGALGSLSADKETQEQEEMMDTAMENTSGLAKDTVKGDRSQRSEDGLESGKRPAKVQSEAARRSGVRS